VAAPAPRRAGLGARAACASSAPPGTRAAPASASAHRDLERDAVRDLIVRALAGAIGAARAIDPAVEVDPAAVAG
jgi:hypothetical protein